MFRLAMPLALGIFISDSFSRGALPVAALCLVAGGCLAGMAVWVKRQPYRSRHLFGILASAFMFCLGALLVQHQWQRVNYVWPSEKHLYQGVITDIPAEKAKTYLCRVRIEKKMSASGMLPVNRTVLVYLMKDSLSATLRCGDYLNLYARMTVPESEDIPGKFDYAEYLLRQQVSGTAVVFSGYWQKTGERAALTWKQRAGVWREKILECYRDWGFSGDEFAVLSALTVGYKDELSEDLRATYQTVGVSHILALSGMHVAVLWGLLCGVLHPLDRNRWLRWIKCGVVVSSLWVFAFLVGLPASVVRAVVMCMLMTLARAAGRRALSLNSLSIAAFFMLLYHPFYLFDIGFQLSFVAVFFILVVYPVIFRWWPVRRLVLRYVWGIVAVSLAAQLGTAPLVIYKFAYFPVCFLPANLIVAPLVLAIVYGAVAVFALSPFAALHVWVVKGVDGLLHLLNGSMQWMEHLPMSHAGQVHISLLQMVALYAGLWVLLSYLFHPSRKLLMAALCVTNCFVGLSVCLRHVESRPSRLVLARSQVEAYPLREELWHTDGIYHYRGLNVCVLSDGRWQNKSAGTLLDIDYMYLCRGFKGKLAPLQKMFSIKTVILDVSLGEYRSDLLKRECRSLGLDYIEMSPKGSYSILL